MTLFFISLTHFACENDCHSYSVRELNTFLSFLKKCLWCIIYELKYTFLYYDHLEYNFYWKSSAIYKLYKNVVYFSYKSFAIHFYHLKCFYNKITCCASIVKLFSNSDLVIGFVVIWKYETYFHWDWISLTNVTQCISVIICNAFNWCNKLNKTGFM